MFVLNLTLVFPMCLMREFIGQLFWVYAECKPMVECLTF